MRELEALYDQFGITRYHSNGIHGQGVKIMVIDTGCKKGGANVHGLAVASLLVPDGNFKGICPRAQLELSDVRDPANIPIDIVVNSLKRGIAEGFDIISISLGTGDPWGPLQELMIEAESKGIFVFAATGNAGEQGYEYPAAYTGAISVASMNSSRQPSPFNTRNDAVTVFAPGEKMKLPTGTHGELEEFTGTSFATPFAAGLAALILSEAKLIGKKISRRDMIDILRDGDHFGLNCDDHTYVLERTCTNFEPKKSAQSSSTAFLIGIAAIFALVLLAYFILKH